MHNVVPHIKSVKKYLQQNDEISYSYSLCSAIVTTINCINVIAQQQRRVSYFDFYEILVDSMLAYHRNL